MAGFVSFLAAVALALSAPTPCPHGLAAHGGGDASAEFPVMTAHAGGHNATMAQHVAHHDHHTQALLDQTNGHQGHGCDDNCDGGFDCSGCALMQTLPVVFSLGLHAVDGRLALIAPVDNGLPSSLWADTPPPRV